MIELTQSKILSVIDDDDTLLSTIYSLILRMHLQRD